MNNLNAYKQAPQATPFRVDLLVRLYAEAVKTIRQLSAAVRDKNGEAAASHRPRAQRLVLEILSGLDDRYGELPARIRLLCIFALDGIRSEDADRIEEAAKSLETLQSAFAEVREEAVFLELDQQIPSFDQTREMDIVA